MSLHSSNRTALSITQSFNATHANNKPMPTASLSTLSQCYHQRDTPCFFIRASAQAYLVSQTPPMHSLPLHLSVSLFRFPHVQSEIKLRHCVGEYVTVPIDAHQWVPLLWGSFLLYHHTARAPFELLMMEASGIQCCTLLYWVCLTILCLLLSQIFS